MCCFCDKVKHFLIYFKLLKLINNFIFSWSLTAIALDKFMHIIDPTREPFSVRFASFVTILIWLICSLINIPYLVNFFFNLKLIYNYI